MGPERLLALQRSIGNAAVLRVLASPGRPLAEPVRTEMETRLGADFRNVRLHDDQAARASAVELGARAYTSGSHVVIGPGGADRHSLAHELTHVLQQREGRVDGTDTGSGLRISDPADRFERAAEANARTVMRAPRAPVRGEATQSEGAAPSPEPVSRAAHSQIQRKSTIVPAPKDDPAETPIDTLSKAFTRYFQITKMPHEYTFHKLKNCKPDDYATSFKRAGSVLGDIDSASHAKADSKDRDNTVIGPYGHFGVMERAIFGRPDRGTSYDGGHLVEHTLMEGRDADVHGNLAPQEGKHFNQGLMRGWESYAENLMKRSQFTFQYSVSLSYDADTYDRSGAQLRNSGIFARRFILELSKHPGKNASDQHPTTLLDDFDAEQVRFLRWIPAKWKAKVKSADGTPLPLVTKNKGVNFHNLVATRADALNAVTDQSGQPAVHTHPGAALAKQLSGTLGGFVRGVGMVGANRLIFGGRTSMKAIMYQPQPQDLLDQPAGSSTPRGAPAAAIGASNQKVEILEDSCSFPRLVRELISVRTESKAKRRSKRKRKLGVGSIDKEAKKDCSLYAEFRRLHLMNDEEGVAFIMALRSVVAEKTGALTADDFMEIIRKSGISKSSRMYLIPYDEQMGY